MEIFLATLFTVICILLVIVVLLQKGRGGGLGAALGGGGAGSSAFGARTGDVFTWVTIVLTGLFLILGVLTTLVYKNKVEQHQTTVQLPAEGESRTPEAPATATAPATEPTTAPATAPAGE